jgi:hypothetical protein
VSGLSLDYPELVSGMESTLRTLVICSFRAPRTRLMYQLLLRYNPTASLLRMKSFVARHDYLFFLLLVLNINCGAFDISNQAGKEEDEDEDEDEEGKESDENGYYEYEDEDTPFMALALLQEVLSVYEMQTKEQRMRVLRRVEMSGALPVARDTSSYLALLGVLAGSYVNSYQSEVNPSSLLSYYGSDEEDDDEDDDEEGDQDDSLCLDGIGPSEEDELNLDQALRELEMGYEGAHSALSGGGDNDDDNDDPMSETTHFNNSRKEAKKLAEDRLQSKKADDAMEKLCIGDDILNHPDNDDEDEDDGVKLNTTRGIKGANDAVSNPFALYDSLAERCAKTFTKTGKELMTETWCMEMNDMENEMDFLDSLVAAVKSKSHHLCCSIPL